MKIKKLIAIDLDGTLLTDDSRLLPASESYLRGLSEKGYLIVLASGRPWRSMEDFYKRIHCFGPAICYNGAYTFDPKNPKFPPRVYSFPKKAVQDIYRRLKGKTTSFMCESNTDVFINRQDNYLDNFFWYTGMEIHVGEIDEILSCDPMTTIMKNAHQYDGLVESVCASYQDQGINLHHWTASLYSELFREGADKGHALEYILDRLGLQKKDVIAFGDADNDDGMLERAGIAYAMKNCKSKILQKKYPSTKKGNNLNGVAQTLRDELKL